MNADLFANSSQFERLPIADAAVQYLRHCRLPQAPGRIMEQIVQTTPWRSESIVLFGQRRPQPRLTAWYAGPGVRYAYSGLALAPLAWTELLRALRSRVESVTGASFNSVLINYYRDHRDSMGMHSDDEPELGPDPQIASLSLGEARVFVMRHRRDNNRKPVRIELASGSLLLMKGPTQRNWKHGIDKQRRPCGPRVNLTFRRIVDTPSMGNNDGPPPGPR